MRRANISYTSANSSKPSSLNNSPKTSSPIQSYVTNGNNQKPFSGLCALIENRDLEGVKDLLNDSGNTYVNAIQQGVTPLFVACEKNAAEIMEELLKNDADPDIKSSEGLTPLHVCITGGFIRCARLLVGHGGNVNDFSKSIAPLHASCSKGNKFLTQMLVLNEATIDIKTLDTGDTPLHICSTKGSVDLIQYLLVCGANINSKNNEGDTPLISASRSGQIAAVKILLEFDADIDIANNQKNTAIHEACKGNHIEVIQLLLREGADLFSVNKEGKMAIQLYSGGMEGNLNDALPPLAFSLKSRLSSGAFANVNLSLNMVVSPSLRINLYWQHVVKSLAN